MLPARRRPWENVVRVFLAIVAGIVLTNLVILAASALAGRLFPYSLDVESLDPAALATAMAAVPLGAEVVMVAGWLVGTLVGAAAALRLSQWRPSGWIVAAAVVAIGLYNLLQLPPPWWMQIATVAAPLAGGWLAERWFHRARPGDPLIG